MNQEPSIQRRLAADIAGYSRLMHEAEAATVRDLKAHQSVILPLIGRHGGRIIDTAGARQIGHELRVRYVLEGSVRRMGRTVRVNAQLIDAGTGAHLWAEQMDVGQETLATSQDKLRHREPPGEDPQCRARQLKVESRRAPRANRTR
jgi:class 3 adenylate cyclase